MTVLETQQSINKHQLEFVSDEREIAIYQKKVKGFTHEIIFWPNGMIEFKHHLYGRVHYSKIDNMFDFNEVIRMAFND